MTRTRIAIVGAVVVCVLIVAVIAVSSGSTDGRRTFVVRDASSALLIEWTRVGDDVSGSMTRAQLVVPEASRFADDRLAGEVAREVQRESRPFTGTVSGDSVRLQFADGLLGSQINGRLDGDALTLTLTGASGPPTLRLASSTRREFDMAVQRMGAAETRRARRARATRERADATAGIAIVRVATAYERALDPGSSDDPCRYMTEAARADVVADPAPGAPAGSCKAMIRFYEREGNGGARPTDLGAAKVELGAPVTVPAARGGFGASQVEGAEVRFANVANHPVGLILEHGQWRIANYR